MDERVEEEVGNPPFIDEDTLFFSVSNPTLVELASQCIRRQKIPVVRGAVITETRHVPNGLWVRVHSKGRDIDRIYSLNFKRRWEDGEWIPILEWSIW